MNNIRTLAESYESDIISARRLAGVVHVPGIDSAYCGMDLLPDFLDYLKEYGVVEIRFHGDFTWATLGPSEQTRGYGMSSLGCDVLQAVAKLIQQVDDIVG